MSLDTVSFDVTKDEAKNIREIARRAFDTAVELKIKHTIMDFEMDITAVHANGCRLNLEKLRKFDDFNFNHDVFGIYRHLDRSTGKLKNCFYPRSARK